MSSDEALASAHSGATGMTSAKAVIASGRWKLALVVALAVLLALQALLRSQIDRVHSSAQAGAELSATPERVPGVWLRRLSLGYSGLLADIEWTRAIQYFGRQRLARSGDFSQLGLLLRATTELDPHLLAAYRFGAVFLAEKPPMGAGQPEEAMQLLRRGIVANPSYWRLWEDLGFIQYWDLHDYAAAARTFQTGSSRPGAEIWMRALAATVAAKGGETSTSAALWGEVYRSARNALVRKSALEHLAALKAAEDMNALNRELEAYQKREGQPARSFADLDRAGLLHGVPVDPSGTPYVISASGKAALGPGSTIDLRLLH